MNFNLLASSSRYTEEDAQNELLGILEVLGDHESESEVTDISGIILGSTKLDAFQVINSIRQLIKNEPWQIRFILRLLPIESVVCTDLRNIKNAVKNIAIKVPTGDTFRITVERRHTMISSSDIIASVGNEIDNKVDLENPDWIVLIEIIGKQTGISVLKPNQIFRTLVEKRNSSNNAIL
jgi:tRNA acetyltransferase TAN1